MILRSRKYKILLLSLLLFNLSCKTTYDNFSKKSEKRQAEFIDTNLKELGGADLGNFINVLEMNKIDFSLYNSTIEEKLQNVEFPYDLYHLSKTHLSYSNDKSFVETILNEKPQIWDTGNWGERFRELISKEKLNVKVDVSSYDIHAFLEDKIAKDEISHNPLLQIDYSMVFYEKGKFFETVDTLKKHQTD